MNVINRTGDLIVTRDEAKANSRVTIDAENDNFDMWIDVAHSYAEKYTNLVIQQGVVEQVFHCQEIELRAPVRGLISIKTYDSDGVETISTDYKTTKLHSYGLRIKLASKPVNYAVVRYVAGFGEFIATTETAINEGDINPYKQLKQGILLLTNHFYENRGLISDFSKYTLPMGIDAVLNQVKKYQ